MIYIYIYKIYKVYPSIPFGHCEPRMSKDILAGSRQVRSNSFYMFLLYKQYARKPFLEGKSCTEVESTASCDTGNPSSANAAVALPKKTEPKSRASCTKNRTNHAPEST